MAIPQYNLFMKPLLEAIRDGNEHHVRELYIILADKMKLSPEDRSKLLPSGKQPLYQNRIGWASTYLKKAALVEASRRGYIRITERGVRVLKENPDKVDSDYLMQFPEFSHFIEYKNNVSNDTGNGDVTLTQPPDNSPQDLLYDAFMTINQSLQEDLLSEIVKLSPDSFERLVVDLVVAMGYGGSAEDAARVVGKTGDEGIDGVIKVDRLGLNQVYLQAKKWGLDRKIGRPEINGFVGALVGQHATNGIFITTASFTREAIDYTHKSMSQKVILIDGAMLTSLMIEHNVGVAVIDTLYIKRLDIDYFTL